MATKEQKVRAEIDEWLRIAEIDGCVVADAAVPIGEPLEIATVDLSGLSDLGAHRELGRHEEDDRALVVFEMPPLPLEAVIGCSLAEFRRERSRLAGWVQP